MSYIHINHEIIYSPLLLNAIKAKLNNDEFELLLRPPCKIDSTIEKLISPGNNKENLPTKSQNAFILYRKNNRKSPAIAKVAWEKESDKVKQYFKILEKLAAEKFNLMYHSGDQLQIEINKSNYVIPSPYQFSSPCTSDDTNPSPSTYSNLSTSSSPYFAPPHFNINYNNSPMSSSSCTNNNTNLSSSTCSNLSTSLSPYFTPYHPNINYNNSPDPSSSSCIPNSSYPQNNKLTQATQLNNITKNATQSSPPHQFSSSYHCNINYNNSPISSSSRTNNNTNLSSSNLSTSLSPHSTPYHPNINYNNSPNLFSSSWTKDSSSSCIPNSSYPQNNKLTQDTQLNNITKNATQPSQVVVPEYVFDPYRECDGSISFDNIMPKATNFQEVQQGTNNEYWTNVNANIKNLNEEMEQPQRNQQQQYNKSIIPATYTPTIKDSNNEYNHINNSYISVRQQPNPNQT
nr:10388_t:CDS:1 [Entrophospora candida]